MEIYIVYNELIYYNNILQYNDPIVNFKLGFITISKRKFDYSKKFNGYNSIKLLLKSIKFIK